MKTNRYQQPDPTDTDTREDAAALLQRIFAEPRQTRDAKARAILEDIEAQARRTPP